MFIVVDDAVESVEVLSAEDEGSPLDSELPVVLSVAVSVSGVAVSGAPVVSLATLDVASSLVFVGLVAVEDETVAVAFVDPVASDPVVGAALLSVSDCDGSVDDSDETALVSPLVSPFVSPLTLPPAQLAKGMVVKARVRMVTLRCMGDFLGEALDFGNVIAR